MTTLAMTLNMLHLMYYEMVIHFDILPSASSAPASRQQKHVESIVGGILMLFPLIALRSGNHTLCLCAAGILLVMFAGEIINWWVPYFRARRKRISGREPNVIKILKPELRVCILHALTVASLISTSICCFTNKS